MPLTTLIGFSAGYEDTDDYLDVQYRLLREDFVSTIREGVITVRKLPELARRGHLRTNGSYRVYNNFTIEGMKLGNKGLNYLLR